MCRYSAARAAAILEILVEASASSERAGGDEAAGGSNRELGRAGCHRATAGEVSLEHLGGLPLRRQTHDHTMM